jgi:hypothetical protein
MICKKIYMSSCVKSELKKKEHSSEKDDTKRFIVFR